MIIIKKGRIKMTENVARKKLNKMGYKLARRTSPAVVGGYGKETKYSIVDENNVLIAGEYVMDLDDVERWIKAEN